MLGIMKVLSIKSAGATVFRCHGRRWMVGKAANRAAVHGTKLPVPNAIPIMEGKMEIQKAIEVRERKRKEIKDRVASKLKKWPLLYFDQMACFVVASILKHQFLSPFLPSKSNTHPNFQPRLFTARM